MKTKALAPWFGSNRLLAHRVGEAIRGCVWVGVPFAGGMCELPYIEARTILVNDLHRHVINLARVVAIDELRSLLIPEADKKAFHPNELKACQRLCREREPVSEEPEYDLAVAYFVCCWMGRSHIAGIDDQFCGSVSLRWNANGGDSNVRYRSAIESLDEWGKILKRCTFSVMDAFAFIERCEDNAKHGLYLDPPFPGPGDRYAHNCGDTITEQIEWHTRLRRSLDKFQKTRIVCRFYDHPLIRELYQGWRWIHLEGRKQSNETAPEVLIVSQQVQPMLNGI